DALYTQAGVVAFEENGGDEHQARTVGWFRAHDVFFTMAENIGDPQCAVPRCGVEWKTTRQPITLDDWPFTFDAAAASFTTVMSWKTASRASSRRAKAYSGFARWRKRRPASTRSRATIDGSARLHAPPPSASSAPRLC